MAAAAFYMVGAVHRASLESWQSCGALPPLAAASFYVVGAVHRASLEELARVAAARPRLPFAWQARRWI